MIRPIETNLSIFNVENKASQVKDPNATQAQAMQQIDIKKDSEHQSQSVQAMEEAEGEVKIRDRKSRREKEERRKNKDRRETSETDADLQQDAPPDRTPQTSKGIHFIA